MNRKIILVLCAGAFLFGEKEGRAQTDTLKFTGASQNWTVPCGVTSITIDAYGAQGDGPGGGAGSYATGQLNVVGGQILTINVGGQGNTFNGAGSGGSGGPTVQNSNGYPYFGGAGGNGYIGGGASDVLSGPTELISGGGGGGAGGGGGGGCGENFGPGGAPNGINSDTAQCCVNGSPGGAGGNGGVGNGGNGTDGGNGGGGGSCGGGSFGAGAIGVTGGVAGANCWGNASLAGNNGSGVTGGDGGIGGGVSGGFESGGSGGAGGGAGGGYPTNGLGGGGGGGGGNAGNWNGSAGGGGGASGSAGSSYTGGMNSLTSITTNSWLGDGEVVITWTVPAALSVTQNVISNVSCHGNSDGKASGIVIGGGAPYTYSWAPTGGSADTASGLSAGTYTITVNDACSDSATATVTITQPAALGIVKSSTPDNGSSNGTAKVVVSGGTAPYSYLWSPGGSTNDSILGEVHGTYCCTVTDNHGCVDSACVTIANTTGMDNLASDAGKISVYPNPNNGQFTVKSTFNNGGAAFIEVYNVLGEKVSSTGINTINGGNNTVDISNQPNGVYVYKVISESGNLLGVGNISLQK